MDMISIFKLTYLVPQQVVPRISLISSKESILYLSIDDTVRHSETHCPDNKHHQGDNDRRHSSHYCTALLYSIHTAN